MTRAARALFIFFFLTGVVFLFSALRVIQGSDNQTVMFVYRTFDLPFFVLGILFLAAGGWEALGRLQDNRMIFRVALAIFTAAVILGLVYLNLFIADR